MQLPQAADAVSQRESLELDRCLRRRGGDRRLGGGDLKTPSIFFTRGLLRLDTACSSAARPLRKFPRAVFKSRERRNGVAYCIDRYLAISSVGELPVRKRRHTSIVS